MRGEGRGPCPAGEPQRPPPRSQPTAGLGAGFRPYVADEEAQDERRVVDFVARVSSVVSGGGFQTQVRCPSVDGLFRLGARLLTRQRVVITRQALSQPAVPSYPDRQQCGGAPGRVFLTLGGLFLPRPVLRGALRLGQCRGWTRPLCFGASPGDYGRAPGRPGSI